MNRALVVLDHTERSVQLLEDASRLAAGVDAELVICSLLTEKQYENDVEVLSSIEKVERTSFHHKGPEAFARSLGESVCEKVLDDDVADIVGVVVDDDEQATAILETAESNDCDHVFLVGKRRSPTGKVIFGNTAQSVILNFDGYVTITLQ